MSVWSISIDLYREGEYLIGFIGVGVMGEPICRHVAKKSGSKVMAYDVATEPLERLGAHGVKVAESVRDIAEHCETVFLSLPGAAQVKEVCVGQGSLLTHMKPAHYVIDLSTTPVALARDLAQRFQARGVNF